MAADATTAAVPADADETSTATTTKLTKRQSLVSHRLAIFDES